MAVDTLKKTDKASIAGQWKVPYIDLVPPTDTRKHTSKVPLDINRLTNIISTHADKLDDNEGIMELLPDLELVREILVANILSPKDLKTVSLNIAVDSEAPAELAEIIREHFSTEYDLDSKLSTILGQALFNKGSYILMPLPVSAIQGLIAANTYGLEGMAEGQRNHYRSTTLPSTGVLYSTQSHLYAMEAISTLITDTSTARDRELLEISDNVMYLAYPEIKRATGKKRLHTILKSAYGLEAINDPSKATSGYKNRGVKHSPQINLQLGETVESEHNPIVLNIPAEAVIPVHVPGEPSNHVGYYIVLDEEGNPIRLTANSNKFKQLNERLNQTMENQTLMNNVGLGVSYPNASVKSDQNTETNRRLLDAYYIKFETELLEAVAKGGTGQEVEITNPGELYRIMFARQLEKQKTRVIYVPAEMVSYMAFNYSETGVGISLLEKTKLYASFRAILTFAMVMVGIKSSINLRELTLTVDEDDVDPQGTVEQMLNEYVALQASGVPIGRLNPLDIIDSLQKAGIQIKIAGNSRFPNTEMAVAETKRDLTPPSTDIMDILKEAHYAGLWVTRDSIEKSADVDYAATETANNLLQAKRYQKCQKDYAGMLSDFIKKYILMGGPLNTAIKAKYEELKGKCALTLEEVIDSIEVVLPQADTAVIKTQAESYDEYCKFIEPAVEIYIAEGMLKELLVGENIGNTVEDIKTAVLALLKRQYLRSENMLPELDALLINSDSNVGDLLGQHNDIIVKLAGDVMRHTRATEHKDDEKTKTQTDKLNPPEETPSDDGTDDSNPDDGTDATDDAGGAADDFGNDDDEGVGNDADATADVSGVDDDTDTATDDDAVDDTDTTDDDTDPEDAPDDTEPTEDDADIPAAKSKGKKVDGEEPVDPDAEEPDDEELGVGKESLEDTTLIANLGINALFDDPIQSAKPRWNRDLPPN